LLRPVVRGLNLSNGKRFEIRRKEEASASCRAKKMSSLSTLFRERNLSRGKKRRAERRTKRWRLKRGKTLFAVSQFRMRGIK